MQILFTFMGGRGHFFPLIPVARSAAEAGHTIAFACSPLMAISVKSAGFEVLPLGNASSEPPMRLPLRPLDAAREDQEFRDRFARDAARGRVPLTKAACKEWRPDVLVCEETDFGSMIAAESLGLPYATVLVMAAGSFVRVEVIGEVLNILRAEHDLPPDADLNMLWRFLVLSPFPPGFRDPMFPLPPTGHSFRPSSFPRSGSSNSEWATGLPDAPTAYFTLGTIFNLESGDLFERVLTGLSELPINVLVTIGQHLDPSEFGPQPSHVTIERYIPQEAILPQCDMVISHGGSGSMAGSLGYGLPSVLIPMGADQPLNAARCVDLGLGCMLDPVEAAPETIREAVCGVLTDSSYRLAAEKLRDEFLSLPGPEHAVRLIEGLSVGAPRQ